MGRLAVLASLLLAGCATQKSVYLPDGRQGFSIDCSGTAMTWGECYAKAGQTCQANGYDILAKDGEDGTVLSGNQYGLFGASAMKRSLVIACK